jgi:hypothetical protein
MRLSQRPFNVKALFVIYLSNWEKLSRVSAHTTNYLAEIHEKGRSRAVREFLFKVTDRLYYRWFLGHYYKQETYHDRFLNHIEHPG